MFYKSTRNSGVSISSAEAIVQGISADGGLFVPSEIPQMSMDEIVKLGDMSYAERAAVVFSKFLTDFTDAELKYCTESAYNDKNFASADIAEISHLFDGTYVLELWHGPTCAFKDMALQILPYLLTTSLKKIKMNKKVVILVATSGDTGKAALEGFADVEGTSIMVFYPQDGVSAMQKRQMATQDGNNVTVCALNGNFDDCQNGVKAIFTNEEIKQKLADGGMMFSSANSINWGRLAPQIVYYVSAYCDLLAQGAIMPGEEIDVCVPTGNFGNIFAAYIAKLMGLPICRLVCASNRNNILTDFLRTGTYDRNRHFYTTMSPSMDILISSNLERLLYTVAGAEKTAAYMRALGTDGKYTVDADVKAKIDESFLGYFCDEELTKKTIRDTFDTDHYLCDTHTAVGLAAARQYIAEHGGARKIVLASTASPYKFANDVYTALTDKVANDELAALSALAAYSHTEIPAPLAGIDKRPVRFTKTIDVCDMPADVLSFAK